MPRSYTNSRKRKSESQKAVRQSIILMVMAVAILILFVFGALPLIIRLTSPNQSSFLPQKDTFAPQVPIISAPPTATSGAKLALSGFGEADSEVVLVVNGNEVERIDLTEEGNFETILDLEEGENSISAYGIDQAGNESDTTDSYLVVFDNQPPSIEFNDLSDGQEFVGRTNQNISISGTTDPNITIYIDGRLTRSNSEGSFRLIKQLHEGENKILIRAIDVAGNETEQELMLKFKF